MALSVVANSFGANDAGAVTTVTAAGAGTPLNIAAGDTLWAAVEWEGGDNTETLTLQKDSGSPANLFTFDSNKRNIQPGNVLAMGYVVVASADASATFKLTISVARDFPRFRIFQMRGGMVVGTGFSTAIGSSTAPNSGNFATVVPNSIVCGAYANDSGDASTAELINAVAADAAFDDPTTGNLSCWYRILSATFAAGAATCTCGNHNWVCGGMTFNESATGTSPGYGLDWFPGAASSGGPTIIAVPTGLGPPNKA